MSATWLQEIDLRGCDGISEAVAAQVQDACLSNRLPVLLGRLINDNQNSEPSLKGLDLSGLGLQDKHIATLASALTANVQLQKIDLRDNSDLTDAGLRRLLSTLSKCRVCEVVLDGCDGTSESARLAIREACLPNLLSTTLAPVRVNDQSLTTLRLSLMGLWDETIGLVADALVGNDSVTRIELGGNADLTDVGVQLLLPSIRTSKVAEVDLGGCPAVSRVAKDALSAACLPNVLTAVSENDSRTIFLNLFKCGLTDDHMDILDRALMRTDASSRPSTRDNETRPNTSSSELSSTLSSARLRRSGNFHVRKVDLRFNAQLTDVGVRQLVPAIAASCVEEIDLFGCHAISATWRAEVRRACVKNKIAPVHANDSSATALQLRCAGLRDEDLELVSRALSGNEYVTSVDISGNGELTTAGVRQLVEALPKSKVEHVAIGNGCFGVSKEARDEVCKACELNRASR